MHATAPTKPRGNPAGPGGDRMPMSQSNPRALPLRWQFVHLVKPYWNSERKWLVRGTVGLLLLLTLAQVGLAIWTSYWHRELFDALEARSLDTLLLQIATFALIIKDK